MAAITHEIEYPADKVIYQEGDRPDSMYMVISGKVRLSRSGQEVMVAAEQDVFGTWALFDDEPRVATAATLEETRLLRIDQEDFVDLLADYVAITQSILKTMVKKLRRLMTRISR